VVAVAELRRHQRPALRCRRACEEKHAGYAHDHTCD
jgi:hypothetical protein